MSSTTWPALPTGWVMTAAWLAMDGLQRLAGGAFSLHYVLLLAAANPQAAVRPFRGAVGEFSSSITSSPRPDPGSGRSFSQWLMSCGRLQRRQIPIKKGSAQRFVADRFEKNMAGKSQGNWPMLSNASLFVFDAVSDTLSAGAADAACRDGLQRVESAGQPGAVHESGNRAHPAQ